MQFWSAALLFLAMNAGAAEPKSLRLDSISIRHAKTTTSSAFMGRRSVSEWTIITATANSRAWFFGGDATQVVLFVGETACLPVWHELRLSCIAPRIEGVEKLSLWGPKEVPVSPHEISADVRRRWRLLAEKTEKIYPLESAPMRGPLEASDLNELISQIVKSADL